jgi:SNF2 family DNA or RNA helicase
LGDAEADTYIAQVRQVYNLVAKDTVEERIYGLLTEKLQAVARAIGKVDRKTGEPLEDFRLDLREHLFMLS